MNTYLPWLIMVPMLYFAIHGFRHRKAELTASDRRNMAFVAIPALVIPIVMICYLY